MFVFFFYTMRQFYHHHHIVLLFISTPIYILHQITLRYPILLGRSRRHKRCTMSGSTQIRRLHVDLSSKAIAVDDFFLFISLSLMVMPLVDVVHITIVLVDIVRRGIWLTGPHLHCVDRRVATSTAGRRSSAG